MTPEAAVKAAIKRVLAAENVWQFMPPGMGLGRAGVPDFVCCCNGRFLAVEAKAGKGRTTALQDRELESIREAGGIALVIREDNLHELRAAIQQLKA